MTPPSSSGTRKSERLGKQTAISNTITPPRRKSEQIEKKSPSPLRRSERTKMPSLSASSGSKRSDNSPDPLKTKSEKDKKEKSVKQVTISVEDEDSDEKSKKKRHAHTYKALFKKKQHNKVDETEEPIETTQESTSQSAEEAHKNNNEPDSKNTSSNGGDPQISKNGLVAGETIDDSTSTSQRNRKRVQNFDDSQNKTEDVSVEVSKRRKKSVGDGADHSSPKAVLQEGKLAAAGDREGTSEACGSDTNNISKIPSLNMGEWESRRKQRDSQKNLHVLLRPKIEKLSEVLHLTEDVKAMVERFLEYVMNNHLVNREPETIFQAFQISLCWCAASFLKQKLDHKESLALAKQHLGFTCKKEEADYVYSMLRCLKRMFLYRTGYLKVPNSPKGSGLSPEIQLAKSDLQRSIKEIEKKCDKLMGKLVDKHDEEKEQVNQKYEKEKAELEHMKRTEEAVIRLHGNVSMRTDKLKSLDTEYARKFNELKQQKDLNLKNLEPLHVAAISNIQEKKTRWVESVKSWVQVELVKPPVSLQISDSSKVNISYQETVSPSEALENPVSMRQPSCEEIPNRVSLSKPNREATLKAVESVGFQEGQKNLSLLQAPSSQKISDINTLRKVDGQNLLGESVVAHSGEGQENLVSVEVRSSEEIPVGAAVNNIDGELQLGAPETASSGKGRENLPPFVVPSSEVVPGGTTLNMADGVIPLGRNQAISSTGGQGNILSTNCSFEKQIPSGATLNVPDEEIPKSTSEIATSCEDIIVYSNPSTSKESETAPSEILEGGRVHSVNDPPPPDLVSPNVESLPYASSEVQARYTANNEMPNVSQAAETSTFNGAVDVTFNVSNPDATAVELREQMQQPRCSESTSNLPPSDQPSVSAIEHRSNNEGQTSNQSSQTPGQSVANHIELSNQDVLRPLHSPIDIAVNGLVRHASETRTASVPSVSNGLTLQTAPTVSSRMPLTLYHDPLQNEMERILKAKEQTSKVHEDAKLQLKLECEKEIEEVVVQIRRKYEVKLKEKDAEFLLQKKELDVNYNKVLLNKILAEAFRCKCMDNKAPGSAGAQQEANLSFMQQGVQLPSQQLLQQFPTAGLPSTGSASSMQTVSPAVVNAQSMTPSLQPSTGSGIPSIGSDTSMQAVPPSVANAQTMGPPLQGINPSARFSSTPTRPPHISTISSATGNLHIGTEIRAPAPHLQPFRPSSSISPSNLPLHSHGMSSQQAHNNHPGASTSLHQSYVNSLAHRQASARVQPGRIQHETAGGLTAPPSLELTMGVNDPSGANVNPPGFLLSCVSSRLGTFSHPESHVPSSRSNSAQQSGGATDIVCLSDDD